MNQTKRLAGISNTEECIMWPLKSYRQGTVLGLLLANDTLDMNPLSEAQGTTLESRFNVAKNKRNLLKIAIKNGISDAVNT